MDSDKRVIQQEVDDADIENAIVIIPALANVMTHDDFRERIAGQRKRLVFGDCVFLRSQRIGRLNVGLLTARGCNEVDFPRNRRDLSFGIFLISVDDTMSTEHSRIISSLKMMFSMMCVISCWRKPIRAFLSPMSSQ